MVILLPKTTLSTLGLASLNGETIRRLDELGVGLFRLNLSLPGRFYLSANNRRVSRDKFQ